MFFAVAVGALVVGSVGLALGGGRGTKSRLRRAVQPTTASTASPTTTPRRLATDYWSLPRPAFYVGVVGIGFPPTTFGALALGYESSVARITTDPDLAVSVVRATGLETTPSVLQEVEEGIESLRSHFGLPPTGPTAATISLTLVGCRVQSARGTRVVASYEGTLVVEGPGIQGASVNYAETIPLIWVGTDWKTDLTANLPRPQIAFPGTPRGDAEGWHGCGEP